MPKKDYQELSTVQKQHDTLIPEEFPEGAYGSGIRENELVSGKSTDWEEGQHRTSAFTYPDKKQHKKLQRRVPGAHPLKEKDD
ncbi:hypothetical protein [Oceanobacillus sp. CFH 90083]|uniref:hypothetical protein n=1 Tax=Oceanobacillus sp. CFH 90083 TaxID=2592336 RepID=UPI00128CF864|nr:hypothetical protein [Oceanobacillus sp. CFH 90083]